MTIPPHEKGVVHLKLESWREFGALVEKTFARAPAFIYRGQAHADWGVTAPIDRLESRFSRTAYEIDGRIQEFACTPASRSTHLNAFKEAVMGKRGANPPELRTEEEWWALGRHHGLATPLLDWTFYPWVALFFAFECETCLGPECETCVGPKRVLEEPNQRAVFAVSSSVVGECGESEGDRPRVLVARREISQRIPSQGAVFLQMPKGAELVTLVQRSHARRGRADLDPRTFLYKVVIPNDDRIACLNSLDQMGINRMRLFPDVDGAAAYVNALWERGFQSSSIGHLPSIGE